MSKFVQEGPFEGDDPKQVARNQEWLQSRRGEHRGRLRRRRRHLPILRSREHLLMEHPYTLKVVGRAHPTDWHEKTYDVLLKKERPSRIVESSMFGYVHRGWRSRSWVVRTMDGAVFVGGASLQNDSREAALWLAEERLNETDRITAAERAIIEAGWTLRYVDYCEDARTPGLLGHLRGVTDWKRQEVKVGRVPNSSPELMAETLEHELRHIQDPTWDCGHRDVLGRGRPAKTCDICGQPVVEETQGDLRSGDWLHLSPEVNETADHHAIPRERV